MNEGAQELSGEVQPGNSGRVKARRLAQGYGTGRPGNRREHQAAGTNWLPICEVPHADAVSVQH